MSSMALDTHAYYKKLVATGLNDDQAEAIASGLINGLTDNLATKDDLRSEVAELRADMGELRGEMGAMEARLIRWGAVGLLTVIAVNLAMMGVMFNLLQP